MVCNKCILVLVVGKNENELRDTLWLHMSLYAVVDASKDRRWLEVDIIDDPLTHTFEVFVTQILIQVSVFAVIFNQNICIDTATDWRTLQLIERTAKVGKVFHDKFCDNFLIELNLFTVTQDIPRTLIELLSHRSTVLIGLDVELIDTTTRV